MALISYKDNVQIGTNDFTLKSTTFSVQVPEGAFIDPATVVIENVKGTPVVNYDTTTRTLNILFEADDLSLVKIAYTISTENPSNLKTFTINNKLVGENILPDGRASGMEVQLAGNPLVIKPGHKININHKFIEDNSILGTSTEEGVFGELFLAPKHTDIKYSYSHTEGGETGLFTDSEQTVTHFYNRSTVSIYFDANTGVGTMTSKAIIPNNTINLPKNTFTKKGYSFKGWSETLLGSVKYADEAAYTQILLNDIILYAVWEANPYDVEFNANTSAGTMNNLAIDFDETKSLPKNHLLKRDIHLKVGQKHLQVPLNIQTLQTTSTK